MQFIIHDCYTLSDYNVHPCIVVVVFLLLYKFDGTVEDFMINTTHQKFNSVN